MTKIMIYNYIEVLKKNYVLICTSNSVEKKAVNMIMRNRCELTVGFDSLGCFIGLINGEFAIHLSGESGVGRSKSISRLAMEFMARDYIPKPALLIFSGFCWGNPCKVSAGNVVVCSDVISLNRNSYIKDDILYKGIKFSSNINAEFLGENIPNTVVGDLVSLETLVASGNKRDEILGLYPHVLGGEMEAFGLVPSLHDVPWVIVKSVSDFADEKFDRNQQAVAAKSAAEVTRELIDAYNKEEYIKLNSTSSDSLNLVHSLVGDSIKITNNDVNPNNLNDYMDNLFPLVRYKVSYYVIDGECYDKLPKYFSFLILEAAQNAFKHGGATEVVINFGKKSVSIKSDGDDYELHQLEGDKGGAYSWLKLKELFIDSGSITYNFSKKKHNFKLLRIDENFTKIINDCTASVVKERIGSGWENSRILSYSDDCKAVYVDDRTVFLPSRTLSIVAEVKHIVETGRVVFVSVSDHDDAAMYQKLGFGPERLKIRVHK